VVLRDHAERLVELKVVKAVPLLVRLLDRPGSDDAHILHLCRQLDPAAARDAAATMVTRADLSVKVEAALILLRADKAAQGRAVLGEVLGKGEPRDTSNCLSGWACLDAVKELLADGAHESRAAAVRVFAGADLVHYDADRRAAIARAFMVKKLSEPYGFYLRLLALKGNRLGIRVSTRPVSADIADEVLEYFADTDPALAAVAQTTRSGSQERVTGVRRWLQERLRELEKAS
jgi:hypothetical protein